MSKKFIKTIYHVVKLSSDDSFIPTNRNIIYTGGKQDAQEILSKRIKESQDSELYALVYERRTMEVILKEKGVLHESQ